MGLKESDTTECLSLSLQFHPFTCSSPVFPVPIIEEIVFYPSEILASPPAPIIEEIVFYPS